MSGRYRDAQALASARELVVERRIAAVEGDLAALRRHRELLGAELARQTHRRPSPELKGLLAGLALAVSTLMALGVGLALL
ncbi:MAG TPA: hypothetical protein VKZ18_01405 [Polyangia bacterium]|nr:hypothetical protein [Polyangia bacterium]